MNAGIDVVHVPYRGSAPMVTDLIGGQVPAAFDNLPVSIPHIKDGKLRALGVTTAERWRALPDVPTLADSMPGFEATTWVGLAAPRQTPAAIVDQLARDRSDAQRSKDRRPPRRPRRRAVPDLDRGVR